MGYSPNRRQSLTDRLPFSGITQNTAITRNKGMETAIEFRMPSATEVTHSNRPEYADRLHQVLLQAIPERHRGRIIVECSPLSEKNMLKPIQGPEVDNELLRFAGKVRAEAFNKRRAAGSLVQYRTFLTITPNAKKPVRSRAIPFMNEDLQPRIKRMLALQQQAVSLFDSAGFPATPLEDQETFELIWRYLNPGFASAEAPLYKSVMSSPGVSKKELGKELYHYTDSIREQLVNSEIDNSRLEFLGVGDRHVLTINLLKLGTETYNGMSETLIKRLAGYQFYYIVDLEHVDQTKKRKALNEKALAANNAAFDTSMGVPDMGNVALLNEMGDVLSRLTSSDEKVFKVGVSVVIIARSADEREELKEIARSEMSNMGGSQVAFGAPQNLPQYLDNLTPMNSGINNFVHEMFSGNAVDFIPQTGPWVGSLRPIAVLSNRWGTLTGLNPSDGTNNYGGLILGSAGSGKTFFNQYWCTCLAEQNAEIIIVDQKRDYQSFIEALEGQFIAFAPGELTSEGLPVRINAFALPAGVYDPDDEQKIFLMGFFKALLGPEAVGNNEAAIISAAIDQVYSTSYTLNNAGEVTNHKPVTLSEFVRTLKNLNAVGEVSVRESSEVQNIINRLVLWLQRYTGNSPMGNFLDGPDTVNIRSKYPYFDISKIRDDATITRVALLLITKQIWHMARKDPSIIKVPVIEEIGVLFQIPEALQFVAALYKLGRAYNLWPIGITQEMEDFRKGKGLINNTSMFIIGSVGKEEAETVREVLGLNEAAYRQIRSLGGQRGVYKEYLILMQKDGQFEGDVVRYYPTPVEYWTFTSAPNEKAKRNEMIADHGGNVLAAIQKLTGLSW